jgi:NADH-quinone oxidoreductase subunit L
MIYTAWLTWLLPLLAVPIVPLVGRVSGRLRGWFAVVVSGSSLGLALIGALQYSGSAVTERLSVFSSAYWFPSSVSGWLNVQLEVRVDGLSVLVSAFVAFVSFLVVVYSVGYMEKEGGGGLTRYYSLILLFVGAMLGLVMAGNLIQFYLFWEVMGVCSALLIAFWSDREAARKAGLKAFVVTRLGDAALLVGVITVWSVLGTTSFDVVTSPASLSSLSAGTVFALGLLFLIGAMGKSAQVPLHGWLPDAMEGPTTVSALIHAATMVNAGVFLMVRMLPLFELQQVLLSAVLIVGFLSAIVGGVCAFAAEDIKRVLAYSTISQLGIMFIAVGLGGSLGGLAATYHMVSQGLFKSVAFLAAGSVITAVETRDIEKMGGLARKMKLTYVGFLLAMLAMAGLPPLIGFWTKDAILSLAFSSGVAVTAGLSIAFLLTGLYSFRVLLKVFHGPAKGNEVKEVKESPPVMVGPILTLAAAVVFAWFILYPQTLLPFSNLGVPDLPTASVSLGVLALGILVAFAAFSLYADRTARFVSANPVLISTRSFLLEGMGFDRLYRAVYDGIRPVSRLVSRLQTGLLEYNVALLVVAILTIFVLFGAGVL